MINSFLGKINIAYVCKGKTKIFKHWLVPCFHKKKKIAIEQAIYVSSQKDKAGTLRKAYCRGGVKNNFIITTFSAVSNPKM